MLEDCVPETIFKARCSKDKEAQRFQAAVLWLGMILANSGLLENSRLLEHKLAHQSFIPAKHQKQNADPSVE